MLIFVAYWLDEFDSNLRIAIILYKIITGVGQNVGHLQEMVKMWATVESVDGVAVALLNHRIAQSNGVQNSINSVLNTDTDQMCPYEL